MKDFRRRSLANGERAVQYANARDNREIRENTRKGTAYARPYLQYRIEMRPTAHG
jgi:hypothetical protein